MLADEQPTERSQLARDNVAQAIVERVASGGHGERGGSRVIYYHFTAASQIALVLIYPKNEKDDLTADEQKMLKQIIERWR